MTWHEGHHHTALTSGATPEVRGALAELVRIMKDRAIPVEKPAINVELAAMNGKFNEGFASAVRVLTVLLSPSGTRPDLKDVPPAWDHITPIQ